MDLKKLLMMDYASKNQGGGLFGSATQGGGLFGNFSNINPNIILGSMIAGGGIQGKDPFSSFAPALFKTVQLQSQFAQMNDVGMEYSDAIDSLEEKMAIFETTSGITGGILPNDLYKLGTVIWNNREVEQIGQRKYLYINSSPLAKPKNNRPVYTRNGNIITVYGDNQITSGITCNYIKKPNEVAWGYNVIAQKALYNASSSTNFELHSSEEVKLVIKVLELAGIIINKPGLVSIAAQKEANKLQQEKA